LKCLLQSQLSSDKPDTNSFTKSTENEFNKDALSDDLISYVTQSEPQKTLTHYSSSLPVTKIVQRMDSLAMKDN